MSDIMRLRKRETVNGAVVGQTIWGERKKPTTEAVVGQTIWGERKKPPTEAVVGQKEIANGGCCGTEYMRRERERERETYARYPGKKQQRVTRQMHWYPSDLMLHDAIVSPPANASNISRRSYQQYFPPLIPLIFPAAHTSNISRRSYQ